MAQLLQVDHLHMRFGGIIAVDDLSFAVRAGTIHGLIGPNGAGKTTTFNAVSGYFPPSGGRIIYDGHDISGLTMWQIARAGVVRTFQHATLFRSMSVLDNVLIGCYAAHHGHVSVFGALGGRWREEHGRTVARACEILAFFNLDQRMDLPAGQLPHGSQRALGLAIAIAARPSLLLLDEPFAGMNTEETRTMMTLMRQVLDTGVTILLVEHDMSAVMGLCETITVMDFGRVLVEGTPDEIRVHPEVIRAYLGSAHA